MPEENSTEHNNAPSSVSNTYLSKDYFETYANQATYESSVWDLKIIFGQLDQSSGTAKLRQTLAINIPWAQAKLALFYLKLQVAVSELQNGKIPIRSDLLPIEPPQLTSEQENDPLAKGINDIYKRLREEFLKEV